MYKRSKISLTFHFNDCDLLPPDLLDRVDAMYCGKDETPRQVLERAIDRYREEEMQNLTNNLCSFISTQPGFEHLHVMSLLEISVQEEKE